MTSLSQQIESALGVPVTATRRLHGGNIGTVYAVTLADGQHAAVKVADSPDVDLSVEGDMLLYLAQHAPIPVPQVWHSAREMLIMDYVDGSSHLGAAEQRHAAELLAGLHTVSAPHFGFARDTVIAQLHQPNPPTARWVDFFREQRLLYMAHAAHSDGKISALLLARIERLAAKLDSLIDEPAAPALLHGDMWTTNILTRGGQVVAFIDPAIYYGHPEIELAFSTLFGTFGAPFFEVYQALLPIAPGFFEERRDLYNLYPLLVHVRLFGGAYVGAVSSILSKFGV